MMTVDDVIESYVRDVARHLPRQKRNDVAFELRALLHEELAAKVGATGRAPDNAMALELLAGFGRPAEAAERYHPQVALIDPADTRNCLIWAVAGAIVVSILNPGNNLAHLSWAGGVFWYFVVATWLRRRQKPGKFAWQSKPARRPDVVRPEIALLGMMGTLVFPFSMYLAPGAFVDVVSLGSVPSTGLELTEPFRGSWQRAVTVVVLGFCMMLYAAVAWQRGWRPWSRWASVGAHFALGLMLVIHAAPLWALLGQRETFMIFESARANAVAMPMFGLVGGITVLTTLFEAWREWSRIEPAPANKPV